MQTKIIATIVVASAVITAISCNWFSTKPIVHKPFDVVGKWRVDTVYQASNNSVKNSIGLTFLDTKTFFKFNADSTVSILAPKDSSTNIYYLKADTLFVKEDSLFVPYYVANTSDSLMTITSKDSLVINLKRE